MVTANESTGLYQCSDYSSGVSPPITVDCRGVGGGAGIFSDGTLQVSRSTISANHAIGGGCSTEPVGTGSVATVTTCTWSQGAGIHSAGGAVTDTTVTGNRSDRGLGNGHHRGPRCSVGHPRDGRRQHRRRGGRRVLRHRGPRAARRRFHRRVRSIVAGLQPVCQQAIGITSQDFNLASGPVLPPHPAGRPAGHRSGAQPARRQRWPDGTRLPFANSPAVDAVPVGTPALCDDTAPKDQRGVHRPHGPACDIGAVEGDSGTNTTPLVLFVNHGGDDTDSLPGDGVCQDAGGATGRCSLRAAIAETNARPGPDTILIVPGVNVTLSRVATGGSDDGDLDVTDDLAIDGGGAVIDAAGIDGVISVADADFTIAYATLTGGVASGLTFVADNDPHELHVSDVTVRGNSAAEGGGIDLRGGSATIDRSTISGNTASARGGGIHERLGTLTITDSTVSGNRTTVTDSKGGGIYLVYGAIRVVRSTVANNVTPFWGAVYAEGADTLITVAGSALANPGPECGGPLRPAATTASRTALASSCSPATRWSATCSSGRSPTTVARPRPTCPRVAPRCSTRSPSARRGSARRAPPINVVSPVRVARAATPARSRSRHRGSRDALTPSRSKGDAAPDPARRLGQGVGTARATGSRRHAEPRGVGPDPGPPPDVENVELAPSQVHE